MKDAITLFKDFIGEENEQTIIERGLPMIVFHPSDVKVMDDFTQLIKDIQNPEKVITIRNYGSGSVINKRAQYIRFLEHILERKNIEPDPTNNAVPNKRFFDSLEQKKEAYKNFKLSHVWDGMSKNPYAFCAIWNMCLTPFFLDPLTGHETKSGLTSAFTTALRKQVYSFNKNAIELYNEKMELLAPKIDSYLDEAGEMDGFSLLEKQKIKENFRLITI